MVFIHVSKVSKIFKIHKKEVGLWGSIKSLFKRDYHEKKALNEVSLDVGEGEIIGLLGANGAGKTTLLKILAGIIKPTSGEVTVLGHNPWNRNNQLRKQISLVMGQKAQLWWDLPAADCFILLREIYQLSKSDYERTLYDLSDRLNVTHLLNVQIRQLSLGERMKMELIAALLHKPRVLFLDEPTIGLDISSQRIIREFILDYIDEHRPAVILTSHYMEDIKQLCKRIVIIRDGAIVYNGSLEQIMDEYSLHKIIKVHFNDLAVKTNSGIASVALYGKIVSQDANKIELRVQKEDVAKCVSYFFENFNVADLSIEEIDTAITFESVLNKTNHPVT